MSDLFPSDPEREARNARMNSMILAAARRGTPTGGAARLAGDTSSPVADALTNLTTAERSGDPDAVAFCEHVLDSRLEEARAARTEQPRDSETGQFVGFDGGVSRRIQPGPSGVAQPETAADLFRRAMSTSLQERAERGQTSTRTIAVN